MAPMNEVEKDTSHNCALNESSVPTTRPETERLSHDRNTQVSASTSPENMRTLENEQGVLAQQVPLVQGAATNSVVDSKETEPHHPPRQLNPEQQQQSPQPLEQGEQPVPQNEQVPETKQEAGGDATSLSAGDAGQSSIGAAVEGQPSAYLSQTTPSQDDGPTLLLNILLTSGGKHPFKLDGKYLRKREVNVTDNDPFSMSVYTLKELIWREWRSDWESRPSSPAAIRLISFGKLLDDKSPLSDCRFNREGPNVVHMTIKPQEIVDEEDAKAAKSTQSRDHEEGERSPGCRCVIL
ncbi:hypothetical protein McanMca71_000561 [Microsporum canis]